MPLHGKHHEFHFPLPFPFSLILIIFQYQRFHLFARVFFFASNAIVFFGYARPVNFRFSPLNSPENWCAKTKAIAQIEENNRYDDG